MTIEQDSKIIRELGVDPESGKLVTLVLTTFMLDQEHYRQIKIKIGDEKNNEFRKLIPQHSYNSVTLEEALRLFKFPRNLGCTPNGDVVVVHYTEYGSYVSYGDRWSTTNSSYGSVELPDIDTAERLTLNNALKLLSIDNKKIKKIVNTKYDEKIWDKLYKLLVPDSGEAKSVQGELIRQYYSVTHEIYGNGSGNWIDYKYEENIKGYSKEYFVSLAKKYLNEHPDILKDSEIPEFMDNLSECDSVIDISDLVANMFDEDSLIPDFSKCTTTQEQLDSAVYWDEYLNWMFNWLSGYSLPEWDEEYIDNLCNSFKVFRPEVPIGVISDESKEEWHRQNKGNESAITGRDEINAQSFIESSVYNWIYQNPDLIDLDGNSLNTNISNVFKGIK